MPEEGNGHWPPNVMGFVDPSARQYPETALTVRRMKGGGLMLFIGDTALKGVSGVAIVDDGQRSMLTVSFDLGDVFFDTEGPPAEQVN